LLLEEVCRKRQAAVRVARKQMSDLSGWQVSTGMMYPSFGGGLRSIRDLVLPLARAIRELALVHFKCRLFVRARGPHACPVINYRIDVGAFAVLCPMGCYLLGCTESSRRMPARVGKSRQR
jgi:hypothetical protein